MYFDSVDPLCVLLTWSINEISIEVTLKSNNKLKSKKLKKKERNGNDTNIVDFALKRSAIRWSIFKLTHMHTQRVIFAMVDRILSRSHMISCESAEWNEGGENNNNEQDEEIRRAYGKDKWIERKNRNMGGLNKRHHLLIDSLGRYGFCGQGYNLIWRFFRSFVRSFLHCL